jgi:hypothetical protein
MKKYGAFLAGTILSITVQAEMGLQDIDVSITQEQCFERANRVLVSMGAEEIQIINLDNVFSVSVNSYHYFVVCRADKGVVFLGEQGVQNSQGSSFIKAAIEELTK